MNFITNKSKISTAILLLIMMTSAVLVGLPNLVQAQANVSNTQAHGGSIVTGVTGGPLPAGVTPSFTVTTTSYLGFSPNPIGIGQLLLVNIWQEPATNVNRAHTGYIVKMTKPDGTVLTIGPITSYDGDTSAWFNYIPDQVAHGKFNSFIQATTIHLDTTLTE